MGTLLFEGGLLNEGGVYFSLLPHSAKFEAHNFACAHWFGTTNQYVIEFLVVEQIHTLY